MSEENGATLRWPVTVRARTRRRVEERLGLRFPRSLARVGRAIWRLPPRSRLRQAFIRRALLLGVEAFNRGDFEAAFMLYHPDCEAIFPPQLLTVGSESRTAGREERLRFQREWIAEWGEFRFEPEEIIDLSDGRVLLVGRMKGRGLGSGAAFDSEWGVLYTVSDGQAIREQAFFDHGQALEAAGLSE